MKKISIMIMVLVVALASCKKTPEVNLKYVDVERDLVTVGTTTANIQCDYAYIATLKKAYFCYGEGENEDAFTSAEMRVVQNTLYVELTGLRENTTYSYFYEFHNGFNSMRTALKSFKTETSPGGITLPTVITAAVTEITANSAKGGGEVTDDGGDEVTERGICWSTDANPTINNSHIAAGSGMGAFTATMSGLEANTTYHVRAYAINEAGTAYGLDKEFKTLAAGGGGGEHEFVDLGLPSGTLWATCNVGANAPEEYGDYFAWGETQPKSTYNWSTYQYSNGSGNDMIKYCSNPIWGYNGFVDTLTTLLPEDDAATANWNSEWSMPTADQWRELCQYTTSIWTTQNSINGRLFVASNGNSLFLPAAGYYTETLVYNVDSYGYYWSSSLASGSDCFAWYLCFNSFNYNVDNDHRYGGRSIRPVRSGITPPLGNTPEGAVNGLFTVNANGDQVYFSQGNLQYQASTNTWRFAEHQWDLLVKPEDMTTYDFVNSYYYADVSSHYSANYYGWIDFFGWGTSGYYDDMDPYCINHYPYSISTELVNSNYNYYGYGPSTNMVDSSLTGTSSNYDWGVYNLICNGGNSINTWRVLTSHEWEYLFYYRATSSGIRYAKAKVNNTNGVVLLPDNWTVEIYDLKNVNTTNANYNSNIIDDLQWAFLQDIGVVFLPAAGGRWENRAINVGQYGDYWSASNSGAGSANNLFFRDDYLNRENKSRCGGTSVRLVQDANLQK